MSEENKKTFLEFPLSSERTMILNHQNTNHSVVGLCQNLSKMSISDQRTTSLYSCSKLVQDLSLLLQDPFMEDNLPPNLALVVRNYGSVYLMAKDQTCLGFLQNFLENERSRDVIILFKQVINHVVELSVDRVGNHVIQKLLQVCNEEQRTQIVIIFTSKPGLFLQISLDSYGTRVVQKLIETVSTKEQISLIKSALKPEFLSLFKEMTGIFVLQKCLKCFGPNDNKFVLEDATRFCSTIATHHQWGCSLLQDCVLYSIGVERERLVAEISRNSLNLAQHHLGNGVVQYIIDQKLGGLDLMFDQLRGSYVKLATQKFGVHVVETCLRNYPETRSQIVHELLWAPKFEKIIQNPYGYYVIQSALSVTEGFVRERLLAEISRNSLNLAQHLYGNRVVQYIIDQKLGGLDLMFDQLKGSYVKLATQRLGVQVVVTCLRNYPETRSKIVHELVWAPKFHKIFQNPFGYYVIQSALSVTEGFVRKSLVKRIRRCGNLINPQWQEFLAKEKGLPYKKHLIKLRRRKLLLSLRLRSNHYNHLPF